MEDLEIEEKALDTDAPEQEQNETRPTFFQVYAIETYLL